MKPKTYYLVFVLLILLAFVFLAPPGARASTSAAALQSSRGLQPVAQQVSATPTTAGEETAEASPTPPGQASPRPPQQRNPGLIIGGAILVIIVIFGVLRFSNQEK